MNKIESIEELKEFIKNNQVGLKKSYSSGDLYRFALDEKHKVLSGQDIAMNYIEILPRILQDGRKLEIFQKKENNGDIDMAISCFIFSGSQVKEMIDFLDSFNQPVTELKKLKKTNAKFYGKRNGKCP